MLTPRALQPRQVVSASLSSRPVTFPSQQGHQLIKGMAAKEALFEAAAEFECSVTYQYS